VWAPSRCRPPDSDDLLRPGAADLAQHAAAHAAGKKLPGPHTNKFLQDPKPTIATGVPLLAAVAISLL
jgi:hippurate hydrolase